MLILAALLAGSDGPAAPLLGLATVVVQEQIIVRVPTRRPPPAAGGVRWREKKGPKCVATRDIAGAAISTPNTVDMILKGGDRVRAQLESACPALDYYSGFYISPTADGQVCADRDEVHARSGGACEIDRFRRLVPDKAEKR